MTHAEFLHVGQLAQAVATLHSLHQIVVLVLGHGIDDIDTSLVDGEDVFRRKDADIRRYDRGGTNTLAVAGNRHVSHHIHVADMLAEEVDDSLGGFGHSLHEGLLADAPLVLGVGVGVYPGLADTAVGTTDADILVAAAEAADAVALEVREGHERVVAGEVRTDRHVGEVLTACDGQESRVFFVEDVNGAESPAVGLDGLTMVLGGVAIAAVVGVGLDDGGIGQIFVQKLLDPLARQDIRPVGLAGVELDGHLALDVVLHHLVGTDEALGVELASEVNNGTVVGLLAAAEHEACDGYESQSEILFHGCMWLTVRRLLA